MESTILFLVAILKVSLRILNKIYDLVELMIDPHLGR